MRGGQEDLRVGRINRPPTSIRWPLAFTGRLFSHGDREVGEAIGVLAARADKLRDDLGGGEACEVADGGALGAADHRAVCRRAFSTTGHGGGAVEDIEAYRAEESMVVSKDAGGAEAAEDAAVADVVERPRIPGIAAVATALARV